MIHSVCYESVTFVTLSIRFHTNEFSFPDASSGTGSLFYSMFVKICCEMCFITFTIVLSICQTVKCNWVQIAQTSKEYLQPKNHMVIDRSHFLSTLNHNGGFFVKMENPKVKISTVNPFQENNIFEYSTESTKMDNVTIKASSNFTNIADWPDSIRAKNRKIHNRVNFEHKLTTTLSPFFNITKTTHFENDADFEMSTSELTYKDHTNQLPQKDNKKNAITQKTFVFKRLEYKPFDFRSVFDFLKNIQKSFLSKGFSAIEDKVKFLKNFKDTVMNNIGEIKNKIYNFCVRNTVCLNIFVQISILERYGA